MPSGPSGFSWIDWCVLLAYCSVVLAIGYFVGRKRKAGDDFFLGGRAMPMWAVAISVVATSLSAATFIGGPAQAYAADLTYFSANIGAMLAVIIVAVLFLPAFYAHRVTSVYELLGHEFGTPARTTASAMFMLGRVMASGARLFMVALPFALVAFGETSPGALIVSIIIIALCAMAYTTFGGIRAVIWTDVLQAVVVVGTVAIAFLLLWKMIPIGLDEMIEVLREDESQNKLRLIDFSIDPSRSYTLWTAIIGFTLFNLAAYGTDQDLTQRMLTCRTAKKGSWSVILSQIISWPIVLLFLLMGLLLYVFYQRPDVMASAMPGYEIDDSRTVFLTFILNEMPTGLRGLMMAGLFAAAMSSMDSALNAMASTTVADFHRPLRRRREGAQSAEGDARELRFSRWAIVAWAMVLAIFAIVCVYWQRESGATLIDFALGVMVFAYGGLLGVFLTALLTKRGNSISVIAALASGFLAVLLMQPSIWAHWAPRIGLDVLPAFPWRMTIATTLSFVICCCGRRAPR